MLTRVVLYLYSTSNHNIKIKRSSECGVVLYLYSTSNHNVKPRKPKWCYVVLYLYIYIKPQRSASRCASFTVVLYLYSTSNHNALVVVAFKGYVVLYLYSTSNHNPLLLYTYQILVVLYLYSTSNHNTISITLACFKLFYTSILHQTTTGQGITKVTRRCFIPLFYIKPQPLFAQSNLMARCFIPLFYIKPQHERNRIQDELVVLYLYSTSNHNMVVLVMIPLRLFYTSILHQTTTPSR